MFLVRPIVERLCQTPGQRAVSQRRPPINARLKCGRGFALYEVLLGVTIFVIGVVALGRSVQNCLTASTLSAEDSRVRLVLANRMAEIQATPGVPDSAKENKVDTGYGMVKLIQRTVPAQLTEEDGVELTGLNLVTLKAEWDRDGVTQSESIQFYVYRSG
jgi:Tfp pilus assembly protein PilV